MSVSQRVVERWIGAVLAPEVRVAGTIMSATEIVPSREYLARYAPALVVAFGRTPSGAQSPTPQLEHLRATCRDLGEEDPLVACDLEQGAGLHFAQSTRLPPALALASAALAEGEGGMAHIERAGLITGAEARRCGVRLVLAPVADVNTQRENPIIAVRSFGDEPAAAAERAIAFLRGLQAAGVAGCAKHFPGHGDTSQDSHSVLPTVARSATALREIELVPFRALVSAGVETIMVAHLDVPALTEEPGVPCTLSHRAIDGVLRQELGFTGVVLSDAMNMGALASYRDRYARALVAGCDGLLCPHDPWEAAREIERAVERGDLSLERLRQAAMRMHGLRKRFGHMSADRETWPFDTTDPTSRWHAWMELARLALRASRREWPWSGGDECKVLDPWPQTDSQEISRHAWDLASKRDASVQFTLAMLRDPDWHVRPANRLTDEDSRRWPRALLPVVCETRAGLGRYGPTGEELALLEREIELRHRGGQSFALAWFGSPQTLPERLWRDARVAIVLAFAPTPPMFAAVERFLAGGAIARGSLPARLG